MAYTNSYTASARDDYNAAAGVYGAPLGPDLPGSLSDDRVESARERAGVGTSRGPTTGPYAVRFTWPRPSSDKFTDKRYQQAVYNAFPVGSAGKLRRKIGGFNSNEGWMIWVIEGLDDEFDNIQPFKLAYIYELTPDIEIEGKRLLPEIQQAIRAAQRFVESVPISAKKRVFDAGAKEAVIEFRAEMERITNGRTDALESNEHEANVSDFIDDRGASSSS